MRRYTRAEASRLSGGVEFYMAHDVDIIRADRSALAEQLEQVEAERDALRHVVSEARAMGLLTPSAESGADHRALCEFARDLPTSLARRDAELLNRPFEGLPGCTDGGCVVKKPEGMHANGGCQCIKYQTASTIVQRLARLRDQFRQQAEGGGDE